MPALKAGSVGKPHGFDGSFHIVEPVYRLLNEVRLVSLEGRLASYEVESCRGTAKRPYLQLAGISNRQEAEAIRGKAIFVERQQAPTLARDEWWAQDLEQCQVVVDAQLFSSVKRFLALPSCDALELENGVVIPLLHQAIAEIDLAQKTIRIHKNFLAPLLTEELLH